jgi:hypothetical protein
MASLYARDRTAAVSSVFAIHSRGGTVDVHFERWENQSRVRTANAVSRNPDCGMWKTSITN